MGQTHAEHGGKLEACDFGETSSSAFFLIVQDNLLRLLWMYPARQIPIALASVAIAMEFYNRTLWDIAFLIGDGAKTAFE